MPSQTRWKLFLQQIEHDGKVACTQLNHEVAEAWDKYTRKELSNKIDSSKKIEPLAEYYNLHNMAAMEALARATAIDRRIKVDVPGNLPPTEKVKETETTP